MQGRCGARYVHLAAGRVADWPLEKWSGGPWKLSSSSFCLIPDLIRAQRDSQRSLENIDLMRHHKQALRTKELQLLERQLEGELVALERFYKFKVCLTKAATLYPCVLLCKIVVEQRFVRPAMVSGQKQSSSYICCRDVIWLSFGFIGIRDSKQVFKLRQRSRTGE